MMAAPVVLLHGWGGSFASTFAAAGWTERLKEAGRRVIAVDLPGHGDSSASRDPGAYADLTGSLAAKLPPDRIDAVGFSLGAKLALSLAERWPERVRTLVLGGLGDNAFAPEPSGEALAQALEAGLTERTPGALAALVRYTWIGGGHPGALAAVLRRVPNPVLTPEGLARLVGPVLLVNGERDTVALPDDRLRTALRGARYLAIPGVSHLALPDCAAFQEAAVDFLEQPGAVRAPERPEP